jgi:hypothetical protein
LKKLLTNGVVFSVIVMIAALLNGCSNDTTTNPTVTYDAYSINGTISFVDTLINTAILTDTAHGYFDISAFANWPPTSNASASAKIFPVKSNGKYTAGYKLIVPSNGSYTITASYIRVPYVPGSSVLGLGIYDTAPGSDTSHSASIIYGPHTQAVISGGTGIANIDFKSWIDTTKKIYKF